MSALIVSVHDIAPDTVVATKRWLELLDSRQLPCTLLVVAGPWRGGPDAGGSRLLASLLRERSVAGDEISQHGWTHTASAAGPLWRRALGRLVTRGASEFWALDEAEVSRRLWESAHVFERLGVAAPGLTPPGWLPSAASLGAAKSCGLRYVTSSRAVHDLSTGRRYAAPAFCQRPGSMLSEAGRLTLERGAAWQLRRQRPLRIGLHPADLEYPRLRASLLRTIDRALSAGATPMTYLSYLEQAA